MKTQHGYFYSHAPRGARRGRRSALHLRRISTHTPLAGRDSICRMYCSILSISTHTPLAGRDDMDAYEHSERCDFYSHAPRGARLFVSQPSAYQTDFYSHAPRGARLLSGSLPPTYGTFLLTRPSRGATGLQSNTPARSLISTHTPLAGRDRMAKRILHEICHFYSHAPRGARHLYDDFMALDTNFYSHAPRGARLPLVMPLTAELQFLLTRPSRGATKNTVNNSAAFRISTHTPLAGRDNY